MQGWRISMEDAHAAILNLSSSDAPDSKSDISFFGVYDGHGGAFFSDQARMLHATRVAPCTLVWPSSQSSKTASTKRRFAAHSSRLMKTCA